MKILFFYVLNGSFIFASDLVRKINQNIEVSFVKISSYIGTKSTGAVKELIGLKNDIKKEEILLLLKILLTLEPLYLNCLRFLKNLK